MFNITRYRLGLILGLAILIAFPVAYSFASSPTGFEVDPEFQNYYEEAGGLPVFGYAVSGPGDESGRLVQYFERQRLELHPEHAGTPYVVLLGHLGLQDAERRGLLDHEAFQPRSGSNGEGRFFEETGHNLGGMFREYWNNNGLDFGDPGVSFRESLALFGYPISDEFVDPETGLVTQYFERARFEHHPDNAGSEYEVLIGHLGNSEVEFLRANGRGPDGSGPPGQRDRNNLSEPAASEPTATPAPEPTATPVPQPTATPQPEPTATPVPQPTQAPAPTPTPVPDNSSGGNNATPGASIQQMVDNAASGATVRVPAGIYRETVSINKPITLIGEPGAEIRGDDQNGNLVREYWIVGSSDNVTIEGFTMRYANNKVQTGAVNNGGHSNWTIRNNTLSHAKGANVSLIGGNNLKLINNTIHHGGQLGIHGSGASNVEVVDNHIFNNNTDGHNALWEAGGMKLVAINHGIVRGNESNDNAGPGLWCDIDCDDVAFTENRVHNNSHFGINAELSRNITIANNVVWENGHAYHGWGWGAGIMSQNSRDVDIHDNIVAWNFDGISIISQDRKNSWTHDGRERPDWNDVVNNHVYNNTIISVARNSHHDYALGFLEDWGGTMGNHSSNNRGENNAYYHANPGSAWNVFRAPEGGEFLPGELEKFNQTRGESNGRIMSQNEMNQTLTNAAVPTSPQR